MRRSAEEPENEKDDFQDAFRRNLHSYRAPVDPQGWNRLEETLNNDSREKRRGFITWLAAACAGLLLLSGSIIGYLNLQKNNPEIALELVPESTEKVTSPKAAASGNSIAIAKVETEKVTKTNTSQANSTQNQVTKKKELNTVASRNIPESSSASLVVDQRAIKLAFENAKAKSSKAEQNTIAFNSAQNGTATAEKVNAAAAKVSKAEMQAEEPAADYANTEVAKSTVSTLTTKEPVTVIAQNSNKNASISEAKSLAFVPENSKQVAHVATAKSAAAKHVGTESFNASEPESIAKIPSPEKASPEIIAQKPDSPLATKTSEETPTPDPFNINTTFIQTLVVNSGAASDSAQGFPAQTKAVAMENSETTAKKHTAGVSKWSVAVAYSGLKFEQQINIGPNDKNFSSSNTPIVAATPTYFKAEQEFNENTKSLYSTKTQVMAGYRLASAWTLLGGLDMSSYAAETSTNYMIRRKVTSLVSGELAPQANEMPILAVVLNNNFYPDSVEEVKREQVKVKYSYSYIGVPIALQGQLRLTHKFFAYAKAGATISRLVKNEILTNGNENEASLASSSDSYQKWHFILNGGAGIGFKANQRVSLNAGTEANCFTQGLIKENNYLTSDLPYSFGLNAGLTYHF